MECDKRFKVYCEGTKKGTLYCLHGMFYQASLLLWLKSHMELWHKRLGHMSQKGLARLCNLKKLGAKGTKLDLCNDVDRAEEHA